MKTKRFCKSTVSLILAVMMLVSMFTVGIVNASAAQTDVATTGADAIYLKGTFNSYQLTNQMTSQGSNNYACTIHLKTGEYWFEILDVHDVYSGSSITITNTTSSSESLTKNGGTIKWVVTEEADYTVTYNKSSHTLIITSSGSGGGESGGGSGGGDSSTTTYYLKGTFNGWDNSKKFAGTGTVLTATVSLSSSTTYSFKIHDGGSNWYGNNGTMTKDNCSDWTFNTSGGDCKITPDLEGEYVFSFDTSTKKLSVTYPTNTVIEDFIPEEITHIAFRDDAGDSVDNDYDTRIFVSFDDGKKQAMTKGVDPMSGHDLWFIEKPETFTTVKFYGAKATDKKCESYIYSWNTTGAYPANSTGLYIAKGTGKPGTGEWGGTRHPYAIPDINDINNKSFGIWVDTVADGVATDVHTDHGAHDAVVARKISSSEFHLYLPSSTPASPKVYTSFYDLKIDGADVESGATFNFGTDLYKAYDISYVQTEYDDASNPKSATLKVYRTKDVATLLLTTEHELFTELTTKMSGEYKVYKEIKTAGSYHMYDEVGQRVNEEEYDEEEGEWVGAGIKQVKGRGNSTFEASTKLYGKYAYNITFNDTVELIEGATKSKKWCLLANNVDHSMMRNTFVYSLADDIGLKYAPETRLVNLYDNGNYMGAYIIAEKVEYGKKTLMSDMKSLDDYHEDKFNTDTFDYEDNIEKEIANHSDTGVRYQYAKGTGDFTFDYEDGDEEFKNYNFLLEFELNGRFEDEYSWFVSPKGQAVVVKYPEFATQSEMEWIIEQFVDAENAIYDTTDNQSAVNDYTDTISQHIDVDSFAKMYLIQELSLNLDSASTSYYIHNDLNKGVLVASPVWDYDWSFGAYFKTKPVYGSDTSWSLDNTAQWFVKNKPMKTDQYDATSGAQNVYNFQAKLAQNGEFWERCEFLWTNIVYDAINEYVDTDYDGTDSGIIFDDWKEKFESALDMNFARWGGYACNGDVEAANQNDSWGTKVTKYYKRDGNNVFSEGNQYTTGAAADWGNTIDYLNDWIASRRAFMNGELQSIYKLNNLVVDETRVENTVTINADFFASVNDSEIISENDAAGNKYKRFKVFVNGVEQDDNYHVTDTGLCTVEIPEGKTVEVVVRGYLSGSPSIYYIDSEVYEYTYEEVNNYTFDISYTATQLDGIEYYEIKPNATVTDKDGNPVPEANLEWRLTVDNAEYDFIDFSQSMKVMLWMEDTDIKIDVRVKDDDDNPDNNPSGSTTGTISGVHIPVYTIQDGTVTFEEEDGKITANVSGKILRDDVEMTEEQLDTYGFYQDIYVNGEDTNERQSPFGSFTFDAVKGDNTFSVDVFNGAGMFIDTISGTYEYDGVADGTPVTMTIMFKSSSSYRYIPSISYGEVSPTAMTQDEYLGTNEKQTQKYYWYKAEVQAYAGTPITLTFNNAYQMNAKVTINDPSAKTYYIGVDNMNSGLVAEILPDGSDYDSQFKRNFFQSAANMVNTEATAGEVAYSVLGGTRYKAGDADGDGEITVVDATVMQMALAEKVELSSISSALSDYNVDGNKSITDATLVQTYLVN